MTEKTKDMLARGIANLILALAAFCFLAHAFGVAAAMGFWILAIYIREP